MPLFRLWTGRIAKTGVLRSDSAPLSYLVPAMLAALLLAGCASTRGLESTAQRTNPDDLSATRSLADTVDAPAAWPQPDWWKAVGDPELDHLVGEALADNPSLAQAQARVAMAMASAGAANAARKPTLDAGASLSGARVPPLLPPIADGHFGVIRYGYLGFGWDLDLWGGKRAAWQAAVGNARAAAIDAEAARLALAANVVDAWFSLAAAQAQAGLAAAELQRATDFLALTRKRVDSGIDNRLVLAQIEGEVAGDRAALEAAREALRANGYALASLLGKGPDRALGIEPAALHALPELPLPRALPAELLARRPDVIAARWRVEAAGQDIASAKTKFLPNLDISVLAGLIAPSALDLLSLQNRFYTLAPAVGVPIYEGGALRANLAGKDAARDLAVATYNRTLVDAINQVASHADALRSLARQEREARQAHASASRAHDLAMLRYRGGVGSFLEALSARQQLIAAEQRLVVIEARRGSVWAALNAALGGGFTPPDDAPSLDVSPLPDRPEP